jgi:hypothetical protein
MKKVATTVALIVGCAFGALPARAQVPDTLPGLENAPPFVADVVVNNAQVKNVSYRMYYMPGKMRLESLAGAPGGEKQLILSHLAENISYVDIGGSWFKLNNNALGAEGLSYGSTAGFKTRRLGKRTVDGKLCEGYVFTSPDGSTNVESWMWGDYPIVSTVKNRMGVTTAKYLSLRPQSTPESYFYPPKGAQIQDLDAMGGMGGAAGAMGGAGAAGGMGGMSPADLQKLLNQQ